jgi:hypothetical protein
MFSDHSLKLFKTFSQSLKGTVADPGRRPPGAFDGMPKKARDGVAGYRNSRRAHDGEQDGIDLMKRFEGMLEKSGMNDEGILKIMQACSAELPRNMGKGDDDFETEEEEGEQGFDESELEAREDLRQQNREPVEQQLTAASQFRQSPLQQNIGRSMEDVPGRDGRFGGRRRAMDDPPDFASGGRPNPGGTMTPIKRVTGDEAKFNRRYFGASAISSDAPVRSAKFAAKLAKSAKQGRAAFLGAMDQTAPRRSAREGFESRYPDSKRIKHG